MTKEIRPENDVNRLTHQQVILLCALVSVISATAAALVVVQVFAQNPSQTVVNSINRITETIIERQEDEKKETSPISVPAVTEGDLVAEAVARNINSRSSLTVDGSVVARGFALPGSRFISGQVTPTGSETIGEQEAVKHIQNEIGMSFWDYQNPLENSGSIKLELRGPLQLGETAISLSADGSIKKGIIDSVSEGEIGFSADLPEQQIAVLIDLEGVVVGVSAAGKVLPINYVQKFFEKISIDPEPVNQQSVCENGGGTYLAESQECVGVSADTCTIIGGSFNECASPCRNDPEAEMCILSCVAVCEL